MVLFEMSAPKMKVRSSGIYLILQLALRWRSFVELKTVFLSPKGDTSLQDHPYCLYRLLPPNYSCNIKKNPFNKI